MIKVSITAFNLFLNMFHCKKEGISSFSNPLISAKIPLEAKNIADKNPKENNPILGCVVMSSIKLNNLSPALPGIIF